MKIKIKIDVYDPETRAFITGEARIIGIGNKEHEGYVNFYAPGQKLVVSMTAKQMRALIQAWAHRELGVVKPETKR